MRLLALVLAACAAAAPLRAGEVRAGAAEAVPARPAVSSVGSLPSLSSPLGAVSTLSQTRLEAGVALAQPSARAGAPAPAAVGAFSRTVGAAALPMPAPAMREVSAARTVPGYSAALAGETSFNAPETSPRDRFSSAARPSGARSAPSRPLALARRIAAALGAAAAPQDLPLESGRSGGPAPLRRASYQHAPGHVDNSQAQPPAPAPRGGYKRLFGPSLALSLMALPSLAHGNAFASMAAGFHFTVGWPLALLAAAIALVRLPVTNLLVKTNPHSLGEGDGGSDTLARLPLALMPPVVFFFAACEEVTFRGVVFGGGIVLLLGMMPAAALHPALLYAGMALASSLGFAYMHRYSELWPRLIGGLVYCAALVMTGSLLFPTLIHTFYNLALLLQRKRELAREDAKR